MNTYNPPNADEYGLPQAGPEIQLASPFEPLTVARQLIKRARDAGALPFRFWRGDFYRWTGTHWETADITTLTKWLYITTESAWYTVKNRKGEYEVKGWHPTPKKIADLKGVMSGGLLAHDGDEDRCIALRNGVYDLSTDKLEPHSETRFNLHALDFQYDRAAECPQWLTFLEQVLPGDTEAQEFLAEWIGYVLSGRTDMQKMVYLKGPRRCGKGTIMRVVERLVGAASVSSPTIRQLAGAFGEQALIGKTLAVMSDVRWTGEHIPEAVQVLLAISGEDARDVARKNLTNWHGHLGVRFMLMSNDPPNFRDASRALNARMIFIEFGQTFLGREDTRLSEKLYAELPGIFNWAMAGLARLNQRGRFVQPACGQALAEETERTANPAQGFLDDFCEIDPEAEISIVELLRAWKQYAQQQGRAHDGQNASSLSRNLRAADDRIKQGGRRTLPNGQKVSMLAGLRIASNMPSAWLIGDGLEG